MKFAGMYHAINSIHVEEIPWERGDRARQFQEFWEPVLEQAKENYRVGATLGPSTRGGLAHEDVSQLFGHEAVLLCYSNDKGGHNLDFFIALPEHILRLTEDRGYELGEECTDMTDYTLDFYRHYRPGWENCTPDSFLTPRGRLEGLRIVDEYVSASCGLAESEGRPQIVLSMSESYLRRPPGTTPKISSLRRILKAHGAELEILRSRPRIVGGIPGHEELYTISGNNNGRLDYRFFANWISNGEANNLDRPRIELKIDCKGRGRDEAIHLWDAALDNFMTVRVWRESGMRRR
jgi:hypothetical protein